MGDVAGFLRAHPPFEALEAGELDALAGVAEPEEHPAGATILTDRDLRRVIAEGGDTDAPVGSAMSAPAWTVAADRLGGEVLLDMLDRCVRHVPVLDATGEVLGVLTDVDLVAAGGRRAGQRRVRA